MLKLHGHPKFVESLGHIKCLPISLATAFQVTSIKLSFLTVRDEN